MRLLAVRLQNLNSLSGEHEVRFDEGALSAAGDTLGRKKSLARQLPAR